MIATLTARESFKVSRRPYDGVRHQHDATYQVLHDADADGVPEIAHIEDALANDRGRICERGASGARVVVSPTIAQSLSTL